MAVNFCVTYGNVNRHLAEGHVEWMTTITTMLKTDWKEQYLADERKRLAADAEAMHVRVVTMKPDGISNLNFLCFVVKLVKGR